MPTVLSHDARGARTADRQGDYSLKRRATTTANCEERTFRIFLTVTMGVRLVSNYVNTCNCMFWY